MEALEVILDFLDRGGDVLWVILFATLALWALIAERFIFFKYNYPILSKEYIDKWKANEDKSSWLAHRIREAKILHMSQQLNEHIPFIKTLVALCPLLGLLGTVTGMIAVFDVMSVTGTGNARQMASGISMATIPTMAGMVVALSGLYFGSQLEKMAKINSRKFADHLDVESKG